MTLPRACRLLPMLLAAGCATGPDAVLRHYQPAGDAVPVTAAAGMEARLEGFRYLPPATQFVPVRVIDVFAGDRLSVRRLSDEQLYQIRLAGAAVPPFPIGADPAAGDRLGAARAEAAKLVGREVVLEVPAGAEAAGPELYDAHVIFNGRCLDAVLLRLGLAVPRVGRYPRYEQMVKAAAEAAAEAAATQPAVPAVPIPPPEPVPMPVPIPEP
jgi:hypothetical protein